MIEFIVSLCTQLYTFTDYVSMPLSAAEKQRRYRARRDADPERRAKYLEWEKQKWRKDRENQGKKKTIEECSNREKRFQRRKWKAAQAKCRAAKKAASVLMSTPPASPESQQPDQQGAGPSRSE